MLQEVVVLSPDYGARDNTFFTALCLAVLPSKVWGKKQLYQSGFTELEHIVYEKWRALTIPMSVGKPESPHNSIGCRMPQKEASLCSRSKVAKFTMVNLEYHFQFWNKLGWCCRRGSCTVTHCTVHMHPLGNHPFRITPETPCLVTLLNLHLGWNSRAKDKGRALWVQAKIHWKCQVRNELKHQDWTDLSDALTDFYRRAA